MQFPAHDLGLDHCFSALHITPLYLLAARVLDDIIVIEAEWWCHMRSS